MPNKLNRFVSSYFNRRDKLTQDEWKKIRRFLRETENDIISKINSYELPEWQLSNLQGILANIQVSIAKFDGIYDIQLKNGMLATGEFESNNADRAAELFGLKVPALSASYIPIVEQIYPVSEALAQFYIGDMEKILRGEISTGIAQGMSTHEVAMNIKEKFGTDSQTRSILEKSKAELEKKFKRGEISEEEFRRKSANLNRRLRAGSPMSFAQCERISKREMLRSTSFVRRERELEIFEVNPDAKKTWINAHKPGARVTHLEAERRYADNPIPVDQPFVVDGEQGQMPRDFTFSPGNVEWCSCTSFLVNDANMDFVKEYAESQ